MKKLIFSFFLSSCISLNESRVISTNKDVDKTDYTKMKELTERDNVEPKRRKIFNKMAKDQINTQKKEIEHEKNQFKFYNH